jgi:DNA-directed RNA polymerase subunit N (RpoN/RPB10)
MSLEADNPYCMKNCFSKCGFPVENVYNNYDMALKLIKDEENVKHSLQSLGLQFEDYMAYDSGLKICGSTVSVSCWNIS